MQCYLLLLPRSLFTTTLYCSPYIITILFFIFIIYLYFYYLLLLPSNDDGFIAFSYLFACFAIPEMSSSLRSHYHYYHTWQGKRSEHTHTCHVVLKSVRMTGMNIDIYYLKQGSYAVMETWKTYRSMGIMTQKSWNTVGIEN